MNGTHFLKGWARTQQCVTMSSAEAELVALVKTSAEAMGVGSMIRDLGEESQMTIKIVLLSCWRRLATVAMPKPWLNFCNVVAETGNIGRFGDRLCN